MVYPDASIRLGCQTDDAENGPWRDQFLSS